MHFHPHFSIVPNKSSLVFSRFSIVNDLFRKYANRKMTHRLNYVEINLWKGLFKPSRVWLWDTTRYFPAWKRRRWVMVVFHTHHPIGMLSISVEHGQTTWSAGQTNAVKQHLNPAFNPFQSRATRGMTPSSDNSNNEVEREPWKSVNSVGSSLEGDDEIVHFGGGGFAYGNLGSMSHRQGYAEPDAWLFLRWSQVEGAIPCFLHELNSVLLASLRRFTVEE